MRPTKKNHNTSHSVPTADKRRPTKTAAISVSLARIVVSGITKGTPIHDTSLKWPKVTLSTQKRSHVFQEASYSKKSTWNKILTYLKAIFPVNPLNSQFCGLTILKTFAPQNTVFMDFPDSAWELSLLTTIIINFHMDTTFTWHMGTWFQETGLNHTKNFFWMRWLLAAILLRGHHVTLN